MNPRTIPFLLLIGTVAVGAPLLLSGRGQDPAALVQGPPAEPPPPPVTVAAVTVRELADTAEFTARVEAIDSVEVRPRVSGHLVEVRFQSGQLVKKGDVLFVVDQRWQRAEVARHEAAVQQATVRVETAQREHDRAQSLLGKKAIASEEAERRANTLLEAKAGLAVAEAALRIAQLDLAETEVRAPIDGRISRALVTPGNYVTGMPGANTVLTTIVSQDPVYVYANVDEATFLKLRRLQQAQAGAPLPIEFGLGDEPGFPRRGTIESFDNRVDATSGNLVVRAVFDNADGALVPGLFGRVRLATSARRPVVLVQDLAIGTDQSQRFVRVLGQGDVIERRVVKLGASADGLRIVSEGLQAGEQIVVDGGHYAMPGMRVTPMRGDAQKH